MFGQYGVTDADLYGYAEIYIVDVASNRYIDNGGFRKKPTATTVGKDGKGLFNSLLSLADSQAKKCKIDYTKKGRPLYVLTSGKEDNSTISFRDFEGEANYKLSLKPSLWGNDAKTTSSFYIDTTVELPSGKTLNKKVGSPDYQRKGVLGYQVRRVIQDPTGKSVVCVIEKKEYNKNGSSIRFMVETFQIQ